MIKRGRGQRKIRLPFIKSGFLDNLTGLTTVFLLHSSPISFIGLYRTTIGHNASISELLVGGREKDRTVVALLGIVFGYDIGILIDG